MKLCTKILLCVVAVTAAAGEGVIFYSGKAAHAALMAQIIAVADGNVRYSAPALTSAVLSADERLIIPLLEHLMTATGGAYAFALDEDGRVLGHSNVAEKGKKYRDPEIAAAKESKGMVERELRVNGRPVLELTFPVCGGSTNGAGEDFLLADAGGAKKGACVGLLRIGVDLGPALATERHIAARIRSTVVTFGFVTGLILFFFMRRVLAPVRLLSEATAKIRDGDYRGSVPVSSNDEIGALTRNFNEMSRELAQTTMSKNFFNTILDSIQDQVIVTDASGLIVLVNPAVVARMGYVKDELIGRDAGMLLEGRDASFTRAALNAAAQFRAKSGEKIPVLFSSSVLRAADGAVIGYIGAAKDVSDLRKLEARMHQSEKLSAVGQLAAGVAHEINNPLGVILGFAQGMARQLNAGSEHELPIKSIEREALRCKALVQNLLTFARTSHSDRVAMDLNSAVDQALALVEPQAKMGRIQVATALAKDLPPILGNKNQLEQVIMNLAKNAIDAMPNGGTLTLSTELREEASHSWIYLRFVDDGTGIPPAILSKIFDPFFTTKPIGQGTGLGLSLVSEIVQKHSGEISVESRPGRTEFTIKLPARIGETLTAAGRPGSGAPS